MTAPSGEQIELTHGNQNAVITEIGAGLRTYSVGDRALLAGYPAHEICPSCRGQLLIPWPNRIEDGAYEFQEKHLQLPLNEVGAGNAIHGLVRWVAWRVAEREPHRVLMSHILHPQPGYPFALALEIEFRLSEAGLRVAVTARNEGPEPCPYGEGAHPYFDLGTPTVDSLTLRVPADTVLRHDDRGIPRERAAVEGTEFDFRSARPIGRTVLDHCFTDIRRDPDGIARVELRNPVGGHLTLWLDASHSYLVIFTGDPLRDVARRSIAVEPLTCPPNAFRTGEGLILLQPGESVTTAWGIAPSGLDDRSGRRPALEHRDDVVRA